MPATAPMPRRLPLLAVLVFALGAAAGCSRLEVTSRVAAGVPEVLLGRWVGTWTSAALVTSGVLEVDVQQFRAEPVVAIAIDNPDFTAREVEFRWAGHNVELVADGRTVLQGRIAADRTMAGTYMLATDAGIWSVAWHGALPELLDLSGTWVGTFAGGGLAPQQLRLELAQDLVGGVLVLSGAVMLPEALPAALPLSGGVQFHAAGFAVALDTTSGVLPALQIAGIGTVTPMALEGFVLASGGGLPATGTWQAVPVE
jgi:hypothetical protein